MKNLVVQSKSGQCGVYNLANALRDKSLSRYADDEK